MSRLSLQSDVDLQLESGSISPQRRSENMGQFSKCLWLTGLSGSGKSTLAKELDKMLFDFGKKSFVLDGDNIRSGLCSDLSMSKIDRSENIRRVGEVSKLMVDAGLIVICALISPYRSDRAWVSSLFPKGKFKEVYINAPIDVCEARDPKGLYGKARSGLIKEFTGISAPYEHPEKPDIEVKTNRYSIEACSKRIIQYAFSD